MGGSSINGALGKKETDELEVNCWGKHRKLLGNSPAMFKDTPLAPLEIGCDLG